MRDKLIEALFGPKMADRRWVEIDFNECVKSYGGGLGMGEKNELLDPSTQGNFLSKVHDKADCDYSYGGYLEDRSTLWRGSYLSPDSMIHLGIDYNAPARARVHMPVYGTTVFATHDKDQVGGWGGRVDFWVESHGLYVIFGHLCQEAELHTPGVRLGKGCEVGWLGNPAINGGWFPHLHLQLVSKEEYERHTNPMDIDGYGKMSPDIRARFPNPKVLAL